MTSATKIFGKGGQFLTSAAPSDKCSAKDAARHILVLHSYRYLNNWGYTIINYYLLLNNIFGRIQHSKVLNLMCLVVNSNAAYSRVDFEISATIRRPKSFTHTSLFSPVCSSNLTVAATKSADDRKRIFSDLLVPFSTLTQTKPSALSFVDRLALQQKYFIPLLAWCS